MTAPTYRITYTSYCSHCGEPTRNSLCARQCSLQVLRASRDAHGPTPMRDDSIRYLEAEAARRQGGV